MRVQVKPTPAPVDDTRCSTMIAQVLQTESLSIYRFIMMEATVSVAFLISVYCTDDGKCVLAYEYLLGRIFLSRFMQVFIRIVHGAKVYPGPFLNLSVGPCVSPTVQPQYLPVVPTNVYAFQNFVTYLFLLQCMSCTYILSTFLWKPWYVDHVAFCSLWGLTIWPKVTVMTVSAGRVWSSFVSASTAEWVSCQVFVKVLKCYLD